MMSQLVLFSGKPPVPTEYFSQDFCRRSKLLRKWNREQVKQERQRERVRQREQWKRKQLTCQMSWELEPPEQKKLHEISIGLNLADLRKLQRIVNGLGIHEQHSLFSILEGLLRSPRIFLSSVLSVVDILNPLERPKLLRLLGGMERLKQETLLTLLGGMGPLKQERLLTLLGGMETLKQERLLTLLGGMGPLEQEKLLTLLEGMEPLEQEKLLTLLGGMEPLEQKKLLTLLGGMRSLMQQERLLTLLGEMVPLRRWRLLTLLTVLTEMEQLEQETLLKLLEGLSQLEEERLLKLLEGLSQLEQESLLKLLEGLSQLEQERLLKLLEGLIPLEQRRLLPLLDGLELLEPLERLKQIRLLEVLKSFDLLKLLNSGEPQERLELMQLLEVELKRVEKLAQEAERLERLKLLPPLEAYKRLLQLLIEWLSVYLCEEGHRGGFRNLLLDGWWLEFWEIILLAAGDVERNPGPRRMTDEQLMKVDNRALEKSDLFDVYDAVHGCRVNWHNLCLALRISDNDLSAINREQSGDTEACLRKGLSRWLQGDYNVGKHGPPSWRMLVDAVANSTGGNDHKLALDIAEQHKVVTVEGAPSQTSSRVDSRNGDMCEEFNIMYRSVVERLHMKVKVGKVKDSIRFLSDPRSPHKPCVPHYVYRNITSTRNVLARLYDNGYINPENTFILETIVKHCREQYCVKLVRKYTNKFHEVS